MCFAIRGVFSPVLFKNPVDVMAMRVFVYAASCVPVFGQSRFFMNGKMYALCTKECQKRAGFFFHGRSTCRFLVEASVVMGNFAADAMARVSHRSADPVDGIF